jgi:hypothetical protein
MRVIVAVVVQSIFFAVLFGIYYQVVWIDESRGHFWKEISFWPVVILAPVLTALFWRRLPLVSRAATVVVSLIVDCGIALLLLDAVFHKAF